MSDKDGLSTPLDSNGSTHLDIRETEPAAKARHRDALMVEIILTTKKRRMRTNRTEESTGRK
jgi:hypothetical protein